MRWLRRISRIALAVPWCAGSALAVVLARWLGGARRGWGWRSRAYRRWARGLCRILGVRVTVEGTPPGDGFLLVSNHLSYLDIPLLSSVADGSFVSKSEVARWPFFGWLAKAGGTIFVRRGTRRDVVRVAAEIRAELAAGHGVFLFPEGTSSDGSGVRRFHSPLLAAAVDPPVEVACAAISYATRTGDPPPATAVCWWGGMPLLPHLFTLLGLSGIDARLRFAQTGVRESDRKALARELHRRISELAAAPGERPTREGRRPVELEWTFVDENLRLLDQGERILGGLDAARYRATPVAGIGAVGQHLRHCLEFYRCFLDGAGTGRVDYDSRGRERTIEGAPEVGMRALREVRRGLRDLDAAATEPIQVAAGAAGGPDQPSTVGRELLFLASHTVHHWALIAALLRLQGVEPGEEFGVAPSTLEHRRLHAG